MNKITHLLALFLLPLLGSSQISVGSISEIAKIKTGTMFFAMKDPSAPKAVAYVEAIKKNWTLSKVECIKYTDVEKNIAPNNSFVTIGANMTDSNSGTSTETNFQLEFWTTNGKYVYDPKKRKHFNLNDKIVFASIDLFADFTIQNNPSSIYKMDYDAAGHLKNWSAAILGNYIQQVVKLLEKGQTRDSKNEFRNSEELQKMSSQTLLIPDYVLTKFSKNSDDESKKYDANDITEGLGLSCKFMPIEELNDKIIITDNPMYYLLFIKTNDARYVTVTNSKTGAIVYSAYSNGSSNFKSSDIKAIPKK